MVKYKTLRVFLVPYNFLNRNNMLLGLDLQIGWYITCPQSTVLSLPAKLLWVEVFSLIHILVLKEFTSQSILRSEANTLFLQIALIQQ